MGFWTEGRGTSTTSTVEGPCDSGVRRLRAVGAEAIASALSWGAGYALPWGPVAGTHGRVFVRKFNHGELAVVELDRCPLVMVKLSAWRRERSQTWDRHCQVTWFSPEEGENQRAERRARNRAAEVRRAEDRETILAAIMAGIPVRYRDGQKGGYFYLPGPEGVEADVTASALGCFRALVGARDWEWEDFDAWVRGVTNPLAPAPRLARREARDPVVFDMCLAG